MKRLLYIQRTAPQGSPRAQEGLAAILIGAAMAQQVSVALIDQGVYLICRHQDPSAIGRKNFAQGYLALGDYDVERIYVERESLTRRGLSAQDLMQITRDPDAAQSESLVQIVDTQAMQQVIERHDVLFSF